MFNIWTAKIEFIFIKKYFQDFGDGGAFPEISVAQYPLNMGKEGKESSSNALAVQLDAEGKVKYDVIARQGHSKDKVNLRLSLTKRIYNLIS